jgi:hypothetical protein
MPTLTKDEMIVELAEEETEAFTIGIESAAKFMLAYAITGQPFARDGLVEATRCLAIEQLIDRTHISYSDQDNYRKLEAARFGAEVSVDHELSLINFDTLVTLPSGLQVQIIEGDQE